ncbi:MAG: FKBP-type peptidyl-prolyl cis-trans isomerase [Bacteroidota bacterium]
MNILRYSLYLILLSSLLAACKTKDKRQRTPNGYELMYHKDATGASPAPGDEVSYRMYVRNSDSLLHRSFETPNNPLPFTTTVLPSTTLERNQVKPHIDALSVMSPGDSVTIFYAIDTMAQKPMHFEDEDYIYYDLVMLDFKKKEIKVKKEPKPLPVDNYKVTPNGYPVVFHKDKVGKNPQFGEYIHFRMYIRNDEGLVYSTQKNTIKGESFKTAPFTPKENPAPQMDAFSIMSPGDSLTLYYQIDTLETKPRGFEDSDMVYYDIVLVDVLTRTEHATKRAEVGREEARKKQALIDREPDIVALLRKTNEQYKNGELTTRLRKTNTGLQYMILDPGDGKQVETASRVIHHFYCITEDGKPFGGSYATGEPYSVIVGERKIVPGWENGLRVMKAGTKAILFVPSEQAYGAEGLEGKVEPNKDLLFYIDVVEVR